MKVQKKLLVMLCLVVVLMLPSQAYAQTSNTREAGSLINEQSVSQYEGQFKTYLEVAEYFGMEAKEVEFTDEDEAIVVSSIDELAAVLDSVKQNINSSINSLNLSEDSLAEVQANSIVSYEQVIEDNYSWWIKAFADVVLSGNNISSVSGYSDIFGFHFGISYNPKTPTFSITNGTTNKSFSGVFKGTVNINVIIEGIGTVYSYDVSGTMNRNVISVA